MYNVNKIIDIQVYEYFTWSIDKFNRKITYESLVNFGGFV